MEQKPSREKLLVEFHQFMPPFPPETSHQSTPVLSEIVFCLLLTMVQFLYLWDGHHSKHTPLPILSSP